MTIDLEHVYTGDGIERNFAKLRGLVPDTGGQSLSIRFGVASLVWPGASRLTTALVIPHGLSTTPAAVVFGSRTTNMIVATTAQSATDFTAQGNTIDGTSPAATTARTVYWVAIG